MPSILSGGYLDLRELEKGEDGFEAGYGVNLSFVTDKFGFHGSVSFPVFHFKGIFSCL